MSLQRPAWLKEHLKKQVPDQITILNKSSMYEPISTGNGMDGKPQVAMPVNRMLHERETVLNAATTDALGGQKAVRDMIMGHLSEKGINKMPMPKESTIRQAASNNMAKAGYVMGSMPDMRKAAGYVTGSWTPTIKPPPVGTVPSFSAPQANTTTAAPVAQMPEMKISTPAQAPTIQTAPMTPTTLMPAPEVKTTTQVQPAIMPTIQPTTQISDITKQAVSTYTPAQKSAFDQAYSSFDPQGGYSNAEAAGVAAANRAGMIDAAQAERMKNPAYAQAFNSFDPQGAYRSAHEAGMAAMSGSAPAMPTTNDFLRNTGFASMEEATAARKLGITNKKDYDAELAARSAPVQTTDTGARMPDARGMNTFRQQYDYAAQQADARSAAGQQALAMQMAQNPNLTQGAQNTMIQEQLMARGAQQSKLAGDAAQSAYGIQRDQNQKAMDAMLAAGDVDGYAQMFQQEFGVPINKDAMKSAVNQKAFSNGMSQLNTYVAQFGDKANANDPITQGMLRSVWAASGNAGEMDPAWANTFLENVKQSQSPIYQALNAYPESEARLIWGSDIDGLKDPLTGKTGYEAFKSLFARDMTKGFMKYDPATQDFTVTAGGALESLFLNNPAVDLNAGGTPAAGTPTFTYASLNTGGTVDYGGKKWTVGEPLEDGSKVIRSDDGTWARVGSDNKLYTYTGSNDTGLQTIGGRTYNNGTEVTAKVGGNNLPINKDGEGNFVMVGTQRVPVTVNEAGNVSIQGSYIDAGKLYHNGKEIKVNGASLKLPDTAIDDFANGRPVTAIVGGKTYKVTNDGQAPTLYSAEDFIADPTPENLAAAIANDGVNSVWTSYKNKVDENVDPAILNTLIESGSSKAKEYALNGLSSGAVTLSGVPAIRKHLTIKTNSDFSSNFPKDASKESYSAWLSKNPVGTVVERPDGKIEIVVAQDYKYNTDGENYRDIITTFIDATTGERRTSTVRRME